jgi:hypothetical protein
MTDDFSRIGEELQEQEKVDEQDPLPLLLETALSLTQLAVILVGVITTALSLIVGSTWLVSVLRGGVAIVVLGLLFWALNWLIARGMIEATVAEARAKTQAEAEAERESVEPTMEMEA